MTRASRDYDEALGRLIRRHRIARGLSLERLAQQIGVTYQQVHKYEAGTNRIVFGRLVQLCHGLEVTPAQLCQEVEVELNAKASPTSSVPRDPGLLDLTEAARRVDPNMRRHVTALMRALAEAEESNAD